MAAASHPYGIPSEECVALVCSYIESLLEVHKQRSSHQLHASSPRQVPLPNPPEDTPDRSTPPKPRRSLDYVAETPNGITYIVGEEYGIGAGYDDVDLQRQRERLALRFSSKSVPQISLKDYLKRFVV